MTHWGWYWKIKLKHKPKALCSHYTCLDSFQLFKNKKIDFNVQLRVTIDQNKDELLIAIDKQSCHFGGFRYFFRCPKCNKRMRKLYCFQGILNCRQCLNLSYFSQRLLASTRNMLLTSKIKETLKAKGGSLYDRPKWMRKTTFEKLQDQHWKYQERWENYLRKELLEWYPNKRDQIEMHF